MILERPEPREPARLLRCSKVVQVLCWPEPFWLRVECDVVSSARVDPPLVVELPELLQQVQERLKE